MTKNIPVQLIYCLDTWGYCGMNKYMQSTQNIVWGWALAGRAQRRIVEFALLMLIVMLVWAIFEPFIVSAIFPYLMIPILLSVLVADRWGGAEFWDAWHSEDVRLGVHSPSYALERIIVQPLGRRIKSSRERKYTNPQRNLFMPRELSQRGAIGRDIGVHRTANSPRARGCGCASSKKDGGGSSNDNGGKGDEEPPHQVSAFPTEQQSFFSFKSAAQILDCSPQTLRNKVSAGKIPKPLQTAVGPRFTADTLLAIVQPALPVVVPAARPRGRPRLANKGKVGEV